jgi:serine/threonine protein kinase
VAVFDTGSEGDVHFIVMEHVPGETLADVLRREARIDPPRATQIASSVGDALATAHAAGIVHRDVKPANVMLTPDGRTKLMDLGIARGIEGESITRASSILGTAGYVSPEQARGEPVDHRSDIYSLGCVLYEMLTGRQPFEADNPIAVAYQHVHAAPLPPTTLEASIPPALEAVVLRAMEKDQASRFPSAADMTSALHDSTSPAPPIDATRPVPVGGATTPLPPVGPTEPLRRRSDRPPPRRWMVPVLLLLVALALLGGLAFALLGGDPPPDRGSISRSPTPSSSPSGSRSSSPSPSSSPTSTPVDSVQDAVDALELIVSEGLADGTISPKAGEDIGKRLDDALDKFGEGDTDQAVDKLDDIVKEVEKAVDEGEIAHSHEQKLRRAIEAIVEQMLQADPPDEEDD